MVRSGVVVVRERVITAPTTGSIKRFEKKSGHWRYCDMVEVDIDSNDCNKIIEWYISLFGSGRMKPDREDVRLLSKIETMRDAILLDEEAFRMMTKK